MPSTLTQQEMHRFSRHFPLIGINGQMKLKKAKVLCIGIGGLGCPASLYLAGAGIGELGLVDADRVEIHNLHRQLLFTEQDLGKNKAICAKDHLVARQPGIAIHTYPTHINQENAIELIKDYDVVLDCTDNYESRYTINYFCRRLKKPLVQASIFHYDAHIAVFNSPEGPCYQCLYPNSPPEEMVPNCAEAGVMGVLPGIAGILQASETIKVLLDQKKVLDRQFLCLNLFTMEFRCFSMSRNPNCGACQGDGFSAIAKKTQCECSCPLYSLIEPVELKQWLDIKKEFFLLDVRQPYESEFYQIGGINIPLPELETQFHRLPKQAIIVCYCKRGPRSITAAQTLSRNGCSNVYVLKGGIFGWIEQIDPEGVKY